MKHAGLDALARLAPLLAALRRHAALREPRPGIFYLKSRAFLHFHEDPGGLFADVRFDDDFDRVPVTSPSQQSRLLARIQRRLRRDTNRVAPRGAS